MIWKFRDSTLDLNQLAQVMGILNVTPDSFSDGGEHFGIVSALAHARQMIAEGAAIIDVGGESTRPGAAIISPEEEIARTAPVIRALRQEWDGLISIDTMKASVAEAALAAGADIVNDVSGLTADPDMQDLCKDSGCGIVVMHMRGTPQNMQQAPRYDDVVSEVLNFFQERLETLTSAGISKNAICFDPGIGFGKTVQHNLDLIRHLDQLVVDDVPLLLGVSRKSFIGKILESSEPQERDWSTVAITSYGREKGAMIHRVHKVRPNVEALRMTEAILGS